MNKLYNCYALKEHYVLIGYAYNPVQFVLFMT